ncbi:MAG TPA: hypothetical protein VHD33_06140 [Legionellaceae bacterium]|nr:hypothetical protein [Legionellaceae bacterium]
METIDDQTKNTSGQAGDLDGYLLKAKLILDEMRKKGISTEDFMSKHAKRTIQTALNNECEKVLVGGKETAPDNNIAIGAAKDFANTPDEKANKKPKNSTISPPADPFIDRLLNTLEGSGTTRSEEVLMQNLQAAGVTDCQTLYAKAKLSSACQEEDLNLIVFVYCMEGLNTDAKIIEQFEGTLKFQKIDATKIVMYLKRVYGAA